MLNRYARFIRFALVGGFCTGIDFALFYLFYELSQWPLVLSNLASYGFGLGCGFFINRKLTFADSQHKQVQRVWLVLLCGYIGLALNTFLLWFGAPIIGVWAAKCAAVVLVLLYNYLANTYIVFKVR